MPRKKNKKMKIKPYIRGIRLERWPRSLAIFAGTIAYFFLFPNALELTSFSHFIKISLLAFALTWGISTANYIVNEIVDAPFDIYHPTKRHRPYVKGEVHPLLFLFLHVILTVGCLLTAYYLFSWAFFLSLLLLLLAGFIYNIRPIRTKDVPFLDSVSESANNPIRFLIGWYAFAPSSKWPPLTLLMAWWAFGNFLMIAKRLSEFRFLKDKASLYRASLKKYTKTNLLAGMISSVGLFYLFYIIFALQYQLESFLALGVILLIFIGVIFRKTLQEKEVMEEPERLAKDKRFLFLLLIILIGFIFAVLLDQVGS